MAKRLSIVICLIFLFTACTPQLVAPTTTPMLPATPTLPPPSRTPTVPPTSPPQPTDTPEPTPTRTPDPIFDPLKSLLEFGDMEIMGFSPETAAKWRDFAATRSGLSDAELKALETFLAAWAKWDHWFQNLELAAVQDPAFKVRIINEGEDQNYVLYLYDEALFLQNGAEQLYLPQHPAGESLTGILLAPVIEGYRQQISSDGEYVEYLDQKDEVVVMMDAYSIVSYQKDKLFSKLVRLYPKNKKLAIFPRYLFPVQEMKAGWYDLHKVLSPTQILSLRETLELFDRPSLEGLIPTFFGEEVSYFIVDRIDDASGYASAKIIHLDRKDLFGDKIILAGVIAHEAAHTFQPLPYRCRAEIGLGVIPNEFYGWDAQELIEHIKLMDIGAEHAELWVWNKLSASKWLIDLSTHAIQVQGKGLWSYCN